MVDDAASSGDQRRENAAKVFAWVLSQSNGIEVDPGKKTSLFSATKNKILLNESGSQSARTILHEFFHNADWLSDVSYSVEKIGRNGVETRSFTTKGNYSSLLFGKERASGSLVSLLSTNSKGVTRSWTNLKKRLDVKTDNDVKERIKQFILDAGLSKDDIVGLSDIVHSSSNGNIHFGYGHFPEGNPPKAYWDKNTRVLEFVADYSASAISGNAGYALICELFPQEAILIDEMIGVIANEIQL